MPGIYSVLALDRDADCVRHMRETHPDSSVEWVACDLGKFVLDLDQFCGVFFISATLLLSLLDFLQPHPVHVPRSLVVEI